MAVDGPPLCMACPAMQGALFSFVIVILIMARAHTLNGLAVERGECGIVVTQTVWLIPRCARRRFARVTAIFSFSLSLDRRRTNARTRTHSGSTLFPDVTLSRG